MRKWKVDVPGFVSELIVCRASEDWGVGGDSEWFLSADQDVEENSLAMSTENLNLDAILDE